MNWINEDQEWSQAVGRIWFERLSSLWKCLLCHETRKKIISPQSSWYDYSFSSRTSLVLIYSLFLPGGCKELKTNLSSYNSNSMSDYYNKIQFMAWKLKGRKKRVESYRNTFYTWGKPKTQKNSFQKVKNCELRVRGKGLLVAWLLHFHLSSFSSL